MKYSIKTEIKKTFSKIEEVKKFSSKYVVEGEIKNKNKMLFVLAGYKQYLWKDVFERIKINQTEDMEVCIASSGKYCEELSKICKENKWIYVSTSLNNICVMTNIIIKLFSKAEYIYKLDEDIYISKNYFENLYKAYKIIEKKEPVEIGYVCPMLPLGFYSMHQFLIETNKLDEFEKKFGRHNIGGVYVNQYLRSGTGVDEFIWSIIGNFDITANKYSKRSIKYHACITRTGIAAILFKRNFWNKMNGLKRCRGIGIGDNGDEGQITKFCALNYQICFCVENILVGHFSFGGSEEKVLKYKQKHPKCFELNDKGETE